MRKRLQITGAVALNLALASLTHAAEIPINAGGSQTDDSRGAFNSQGAVTQTGASWKVLAGSWQVRSIATGTAALEATRNYTLFTIPALNASNSILSATVKFPHPNNSYDSPDSSESVGLWSIDGTSFADLRSNALTTPGVGNRPDIFTDLGSGTSYGTFFSTAANNGTVQTIVLNAAAITKLNAVAHQAGGGVFGFGAAIRNPSVTAPMGDIERVFRGTGGTFTTPTVLTITTSAAAVPALSPWYTLSLAALLSGLAALVITGQARRRRLL